MISLQRSAWFPIVVATCFTACGGEQPPAEAPPPPATVAAPTPPPPPPPVEAPAPTPKTAEEIAKWYSNCWDLVNAKNMDEFPKCYATDATATIGSNPMVLHGRDAIVEADAKNITTAFPDFHGELELTLVNGDHVVALALINGTQTGPLSTPDGGTIAPTKKKVGYMMMHSVDVNPAGEATTQWEVMNTPTLLAQLGLSKAPARPIITQGWPEKLVVIAKNDDTEAKNVAAHKQAYELFNKHDPAMADVMSDKIVCQDPTMPKDIVGKKQNIGMLQSFWKAFSDINGQLDQVWGAGDYTVAFGHMTGTNDGNMPEMHLKKTGKKIDVRFGEIIKWEDGKAAQVYPYMDSMDMAAQLGLLDHPKPAPAAGGGKAAPAKTAPAMTSTKPTPSKAPAATGTKTATKK